ncbi:MAG: class I SAM-dependent methyltransferase [Pseudobdellovibrionaceae bacterium]
MAKTTQFQHLVSQIHQLKGAQSFQTQINQFVQILSETHFADSVTPEEIELLKSEKIYFSEKGLQFSASASRLDSEIYFDFDNDVSYARSNPRGKNDLLLKAIGFKNQPLRVLDLTAGLLRDAIFMAQAGCQVTSLERDFLLYLCLSWGIMKSESPCVQSLNLLHRTAQEFLKKQSLLHYDVIYYDPMYPETKSSALPKKEIQFLRDHIGEDKDRDEMIQFILASNIRSRIVFKRHPGEKNKIKKEKPLAVTNQQIVLFEGKSVVFEVYISKPKI